MHASKWRQSYDVIITDDINAHDTSEDMVVPFSLEKCIYI